MILLVVAAAVAVFFINKKPAKVAAVADRDELQNSFNAFDSDGSGELNKAEFRIVMSMSTAADKALTDIEFETFFSAVDKDGSGSISFDEYYAWSTSTKTKF